MYQIIAENPIATVFCICALGFAIKCCMFFEHTRDRIIMVIAVLLMFVSVGTFIWLINEF